MLNKYIDHTLLLQTATEADIHKLCEQAKQYQFFGVCVPPTYVGYAKNNLKNSAIQVVTVIGFPFGYHSSVAKIAETQQAIIAGANEVDVVINISQLVNGHLLSISDELSQIREITKDAHVGMKVIIESGILTDDEIITACKLANMCHVDFIKTSTGYAKVSATEHAVKLISKHKLPHIQIKASGGIRNKAQAQAFIDLGVTRLGTSSGVEIINDQTALGTY